MKDYKSNELFQLSVQYVLDNEGGLTDDPDDPGGLTNYGITMPVLLDYKGYPDSINVDYIRELTVEEAKHIYYNLWWERYRYDRINRLAIVRKLLDFSVVMGPKQGHTIFQRALNALGLELPKLVEDGWIGEKTLAVYDEATKAPAVLLSLRIAMNCEAAGVFRLIAQKKPKLRKFLQGWLARAYR